MTNKGVHSRLMIGPVDSTSPGSAKAAPTPSVLRRAHLYDHTDKPHFIRLMLAKEEWEMIRRLASRENRSMVNYISVKLKDMVAEAEARGILKVKEIEGG